MRNIWLHVALMASVLGWCPRWFGWVWILGCAAWLWRIQHFKMLLSISILVCVQLRLYPKTFDQPPNTQIVEITDIKSNYVIAKSEVGSIVLYQTEGLGFQDVIEIKGECEPIHSAKNFYLFDFKEWANKRNIGYSCKVEQSKSLSQGNTARARLYRFIQTMEDGPRVWLLQTLYGIQNQETKDISYLVSSSGMHLSYLAHLVEVLLTLWLPKILAQGTSLLLIIILGSVTTMKDALLRILFFRCASFAFVKESVHDRLGIGMLSLLLLYPHMIQELSYVLPVMFRLVYLFHVRKRNKRILSIAVLTPIQFMYFNQVDVLALLLFPFLRKVYAIAYLLAILYIIVPWLFLYEIAQFLLSACTLFHQIQFPLYYHAGFIFVWTWFYLLFCFISNRTKHSGYMLVGLFLYTQVAPYLRPYAEVVMLDVGQGDSTLISLPFNQGNILIDVAGNPFKNIPEDIIVPSLHALGIKNLDYVILTHDDFDHSGGLSQLQELMEVDQVIQTKQELLTIKDTTFNFLLWDQEYDDKNENSIVTFIELYGLRFIFMGDAGKSVEREILQQYPNLIADIIKVGHHGSATSSDASFIHQLHSQIALISCGYNNRYGHPSPQTIETLKNENVYVLNTPNDGAVSIKVTNFIRFYNTAAHEFGIIKIR